MKRYIKSSDSIRTPKITSVTPMYTGGSIYIYWGAFSDGTYFMSCDDYWDLRIVNEDPRNTHNGDYFEADYPDWQEEHLIKDIPNYQTQDFFNEMYDWILANNPEGNYNSGDIEERKQENNSETGGPGDRDRCDF